MRASIWHAGWALPISLAALEAVDGLASMVGVRLGVVREANPVVASLAASGWLVVVKVLAGWSAGAWLRGAYGSRIGRIALACCVVEVGAAALWAASALIIGITQR